MNGFLCRVQRAFRVACLLTTSLVLILPTTVLAGGGKPESKLVNVADTRDMEPGISKFIADVYNESFLLYGILVVVVMALMGGLLGLVTDKVFALLGVHLGKLEHHE